MQSKLEILEQLLTNVQNTRDLDVSSIEETEELNRIESDISKALEKERAYQQIKILDIGLREIELQNRLNNAFKEDQSHIKRLSQN